jgi:hypothetical protein
MADSCMPVFGIADQIVEIGWTDFRGFAEEAYNVALTQVANLGNFTVADTPISLSYTFPDGTSIFVPPSAPTRTISVFEMPDLPSDVVIATPAFDNSLVGARPEAPTDLPVYTAPTRPNVVLPDAPDSAVVLDPLTIPDAPSYTLPEAPTFVTLNLPEVPVFTLPSFTGVRPDITSLDAPDNTFDFQEVAYSSTLLDQIRTRLAAMGQGGTGLPAAVEQALFDRARGREDQLVAVEVATALDEWARLGYEEPAGVLNARIERVRQGAQNKQVTLSRDVYIQAQTVEIENLRFFVTQGIALEQTLIQQHMAVQERALRFAQAVVTVAIDLFNAEIAKANLETQLYSTDAQVFRDRLQAEIARAELYKAQIEGELAKGQINEQAIRRYEAQLRTIGVLTDIYKVSVDAVKARGEINVQRLEAKRTEVQVFAEQVRGYSAAWDGFKAQVEGELGNVRMAELATNRFATLTGAWQTQNNVAVARLQSQLASENFKLQQGEADLRRYLAQIQAQTARVDSDAKALSAESQVYSAAGQIALAQSNAQDRQLQTQIATIRADAELQLKRGEMSTTVAIQRAQLILDSMKSLGTIAAQLAASAMSAVNLSASISENTANSSSCSTSYSLSGELS